MSNRFSPLDLIKQQQEENKYRTQVLDLREIQEHPKNDFPIHDEDIERLADSIYKSGEVLQYPLVRMLPDRSFQMLSGHRRRRASILLGDLGHEKFYRTMCKVVEDISDEKAELYLIETNIQARMLSPKVRAKKVEDARELLIRLRDRGEVEVVNIKKAVAEATGMSESTVILQTRIAKQLAPELMDIYDAGLITMRQAYDYAGLSLNRQYEIADVLTSHLSDKTKEEKIKQIIIEDNRTVGEGKERQKLATRKLKQAYQRLSGLLEYREELEKLDRSKLVEMRDLLSTLLEDKNENS